MRNQSKVAPGWWDYTTLDREILDDAARLTEKDILQLSRPGFKVTFYETLQEFYAAEALEYIEAWLQATEDRPCGICGPIGPTEQLPIVAQIVNAIGLRNCHFWGMDEGSSTARPSAATSPSASRRPTANSASTASAPSSACPTRTSTSPTPTPRPTASPGRTSAA